MAVGAGPGAMNANAKDGGTTPKLLGGTAIKPVERHGMEAVKWFFYDKNTGAIMGRTPKSWALIILFYIVYYTFLACFWLAMLMIFFQTIDENKPKWISENGIIGTSPGLGLRPKQTDALIDSSMITYNKDSETDGKVVPGYGTWSQRAADFIKSYENGTSTKNCTKEDGTTAKRACIFDTSVLGFCRNADRHFGYSVGKPCIFLKLNKIYGLKNDHYNNPNDLPEEMPEQLKEHIKAQEDKEQVWINCKGENPADLESLGEIEYFPKSRGIPDMYFPYMKQPNYQSPIVAVHFKNPKIGQLLHVECRAWAKNIRYDRMDRIGIAHLELLIFDEDHAKMVEEANK